MKVDNRCVFPPYVAYPPLALGLVDIWASCKCSACFDDAIIVDSNVTSSRLVERDADIDVDGCPLVYMSLVGALKSVPEAEGDVKCPWDTSWVLDALRMLTSNGVGTVLAGAFGPSPVEIKIPFTGSAIR